MVNRERSEVSFETILLDACDRFLEEIEKFKFYLLYESDFRCAIYAELVKVMDEKGMADYPIKTEHKYRERQADISLGRNQEIAVEMKFTYTYLRPKRSGFQEAKEQLEYYLMNGAKKAYLVYLDFQPPPESVDTSKVFDIEEFGLSGEWKPISTEEGTIGEFLIATARGGKR